MKRLDEVIARQRKLFWENLAANLTLIGALCVSLATLL